MEELKEWGKLDASNESKYTKVHGLEHKYPDTALLLVTDVCGIYCRFCFRKRLFMNDNDEVARDITEGLKYIKENTEINNVLLTGGDPLILSTKILELFEWFNNISSKKLYLMNHFNHPRELTEEAKEAIRLVLKTGTAMTNQTPVLKGINDSADTLQNLLEELSFNGVAPYYLFQCRPTVGNEAYSTYIEETIDLIEEVRSRMSGLGARVLYVMSHESGKIEILGKTEEYIYFRYHRSASPENRGRFLVLKSTYTSVITGSPENRGRFLVFRRNPEARWFDDYTDLIESYRMEISSESVV